MNLVDRLYNELEMVEYKLDRYRNEEISLSEREVGILLGKENILKDLIEDAENGNID